MSKFIKIGYLLVIWVRLSLVPCLSQSIEATNDTYKFDIEKFSKVGNWSVLRFGQATAELLKTFISAPAYGTVINIINGSIHEKNKFFKTATRHTFILQGPITTGVVIGSLIALTSLFLPFFIAFYRNRQIKFPDKWSFCFPSNRRGSFIFEVFIVCSCTALFGAIVLSFSSIPAYRAMQVPFKFAERTVEAAFDQRELLRRNYQNHIRDVSQNTFDTTAYLFNVNEKVGTNFMERIQQNFMPILNLAGAMNYGIAKSAESLDHQRNHLYEIVNNSMQKSKVYADEFTSAVNQLQNEYKEAASDLKPLLNMPVFHVTADVVEMLKTPIKVLTEASKLNLQAGYQEAYFELQLIAFDDHFNTLDLIDKLQRASLTIEKKMRPPVEKYLAFVEANFRNEDLVVLVHQIREIESDTLYSVYIFVCFMAVIGSLSIILIGVTIVAYVIIICGSKSYQIDDSLEIKKTILNPVWAIRSGRVLLFCCYGISGFLWVCCVLNVILFLLASLPLQICMTIQDNSIYNATFDSKGFQQGHHWYRMFTSPEYNTTLRDCINHCSAVNSCATFLPETVVSRNERDNVLSELNFTATSNSFQNDIRNLTAFNISFTNSSMENLTNVLNDVNIHPLFRELKNILQNVSKLNAIEVLNKVKKSANHLKVSELVSAALNAYSALETELLSSIGKELELKTELEMVNASLHTVKKDLIELVRISDALYSVIVNESSSIYSLTLNQTVSEILDDIFLQMKLGITDFRKSLSYCEHLSTFHENSQTLFCNIVLYPISVCWLGSLLLWIFLLPTVWMSVPVVHLFADPSKELSTVNTDQEAISSPTVTSSEKLGESYLNQSSESTSSCQVKSRSPKQGSSSEGKDSEVIELKTVSTPETEETTELDNEEKPTMLSSEKSDSSNPSHGNESFPPHQVHL